jgi:hypothetical protein
LFDRAVEGLKESLHAMVKAGRVSNNKQLAMRNKSVTGLTATNA